MVLVHLHDIYKTINTSGISWRCSVSNVGPSGEKIPAKVTRTPVDGQHVEFTPREAGKTGSNFPVM